MKNKFVEKIILFILGMFCFYISQIVLRIPLISYINSKISIETSLNYGFLISVIIVLSAGLFEEGFRFIFRQFLLKDSKIKEIGLIPFENIFEDAIIFGLGHGICEVIFIIYLSGYNLLLPEYILVTLERILAVIFHCSMAVLIFRGFNLNKKFQYLFLAIIMHSLFNLPTLFTAKISIFGVHLILLIIDVFLAFYLKRIKNKWGAI